MEILTISQLLFLNNFSELLCKKAKVMLSAVFNNLKLDGSCENLIVGQKNIEAQYVLIECSNGSTEQLKSNIVLMICAMFYNFGQLINDLFNEEPSHFRTFCHLVRTVYPQQLSSLDRNGNIP